MRTLGPLLYNLRNSTKGINFIHGINDEKKIKYGELYEKALVILAHLQEKGLYQESEVVLQIEDEEIMLYTLWGCILGGLRPIVVSLAKTDAQMYRIEKILTSLKKPCVIVDDISHQYIQKLLQKIHQESEKRIIHTDEILHGSKKGVVYDAKPEDIAMIMYSSGSTGVPKGACITHQNIYEGNIETVEKYKLTEKDVSMNWMSLTHMVGISFCHMTPLFAGMEQYHTDKSLFLNNPDFFLQLASRYKVSMIVIPSFAMKHILTKCNFEKANNWDLSNIKLISCSGENVSYVLTEEFGKKLRKFGLNHKAICPLYGTTEAQVISSVGLFEGVTIKKLDRSRLSVGMKVKYDESENAVMFTELGEINTHHKVRICDDNSRELDEEFIGNIQVNGAGVTNGYYKDEINTKKIFSDSIWLNTGDIGFISKNKLTIIGRRQEMVIINAVNYYLSDIERIANNVEGVKKGNLFACGVKDIGGKDESIVLFAETGLSIMEYNNTAIKIHDEIQNKIGLDIAGLVVINECPRTETGKADKVKLVRDFTAGEYKDDYITFNNKGSEDDGSLTLIESKIIQIWISIIGVKKIGVNQNFFQIGGDSVNAFEMLDKVMNEFNVNLNIRTIYQRKTVREFAALVEAEMNKGMAE